VPARAQVGVHQGLRRALVEQAPSQSTPTCRRRTGRRRGCGWRRSPCTGREARRRGTGRWRALRGPARTSAPRGSAPAARRRERRLTRGAQDDLAGPIGRLRAGPERRRPRRGCPHPRPAGTGHRRGRQRPGSLGEPGSAAPRLRRLNAAGPRPPHVAAVDCGVGPRLDERALSQCWCW
jgi:hypothetical protein